MNKVVIFNKLCALSTLASTRASKDKENLRFGQFGGSVEAADDIGENVRGIIEVIVDNSILEGVCLSHDDVHL